ncbi:MAG TPA: sugar phosphate nucleotidyltransferase [Pyrinomonadaceae bacterium]|nr:sugar phosphate nucleotidyltransferase [Pyrinomonadaceae bacterium]
MKIRQALIMAAGRGMRMMPLTDAIPKPMAPFKGRTLIADGIDKLSGKLEMIHITIGYRAAMLAQHVIEHGATSVHNTEGHSNCWWIYNTLLRNIDEPIYVLTCDNVVELNFEILEEHYFSLGAPPCMIVPVRPVEGLEGDYVFHEDGVVTEIARKKPSDIYCSGIQVLNPARVRELTTEGESFYDVWNQLIAQRQLLVSSVYPDKWYAVDTIEQLRRMNEVE